MLKKFPKATLIACITGLSAVSLIIAQAYMVFEANSKIDNGQVPGIVGLRQYFDSGDGSETDPYVITRPIHLFNLSRLNAIGAFTSQKYFQLGSTSPLQSTDNHFYSSDDSNDTKSYLDMTDYSRTLVSIGSTSSPFFGIFNGQNLTVKGLTVASDPEDIGVFGYIAPSAKVINTRFANLSITDNGYQSFTSEFYTASIEANSSLNLLSYVASGSSRTITTTSFSTSDLTGSFNLDTTGLSDLITYSPIEYGIRSTNPTLYTVSEDKKSITINTSALTNSTSFYSASGTRFSSRIYGYASIIHENIQYAKIIGSWTVNFDHTISTDGNNTHTITMSVVRDRDADSSTYEHNTNVGFVAGHCDGSLSNDYVYNGTLHLNNVQSSYNLKAESELGLVGEVGVNIDNTISPIKNYDDAGDTGILNFTNIYKNIIDVNDTVWASESQLINGTTYSFVIIKYRKDGNLYDEVLRKRDASTDDQTKNGTTDSSIADVAVTNEANSIDFQGQRIIKENDDYSRGLGIFSLNTSGTSYSQANYVDGLGDFTIKYDSDENLQYSNVFYTTAEFNATLDATKTPKQYYQSLASGGKVQYWTPTSTLPDFRINQGIYMPPFADALFQNTGDATDIYSTPYRFSSAKFEKNFNYLIKFSLEDLSGPNGSASDNYFWNTNSGFLSDYFKYKLKDKTGKSLDKTNSDFGLMIKEKNGSTYSNTTLFSSYLGITKQTSGKVVTMTVDGSTVPIKTVEFSVKNDDGANITMIVASDSTTAGHACIYDKAKTSFNTNTEGYYPSYAMYVPSNYTQDNYEADMPYYFTYDNSAKNVTSSFAESHFSSKTTPTVTENRLYAHTFFLPKGEYYIGSPDIDLKVYYIAAQGQNGLGNLGGKKSVFNGEDVISDLDFLLYDPTQGELMRAYVSLALYSNKASNDLTVTADTASPYTLNIGFSAAAANYKYMAYNYNRDTKANTDIKVNGTTYSTLYISSDNWGSQI
jgi:hypothetical protein